MTEYVTTRNPDRCPAHPGELLLEIIPATNTPKTRIAAMLGISRQLLYDILDGRKPVSPTVAAKLGKMFGDGPGPWLRMQAAYDAWHAERDVDTSHIPVLPAAE